MCMVLYYLINDTINKLLMTTTRKKGQQKCGSRKTWPFLGQKGWPFFCEKTTVRINEENWWHYDPLPIFWGAVRTNKLSEFCWWWIFMWRKKSSQLVNLLAFTTPHVIVSIYHFFFFYVWRKKTTSKINLLTITFVEMNIEMPHFFLKRRRASFSSLTYQVPHLVKDASRVPSIWNVDCNLIRVELTSMYFHVICGPKLLDSRM